jgi:hypothetical protein
MRRLFGGGAQLEAALKRVNFDIFLKFYTFTLNKSVKKYSPLLIKRHSKKKPSSENKKRQDEYEEMLAKRREETKSTMLIPNCTSNILLA